MKKIISLFLTFTLLLGTMAISARAEFSEAENLLVALGVVDRGSYDADKVLSRAEFAEIIAGICNLMDADKGYKAWYENAFGKDNNDVLLSDSDQKVFVDVDSTLPQYEAIMSVYNCGYMNGMTPAHFGPNYDITMGEVVKVIVSILGYAPMAEIKGGYPNGYIQTATSIKLTSGISYAPSDFATYGMVADIIYAALDIPVYEFNGMGEDYIDYEKSDETFLTESLGLERAEGVVTDNGISTLHSASGVGETMIAVDNVKMYIENCTYAREYIGRRVNAYYVADNGRNHLVYMCISPDDDAISVDIEDYSSYDNSYFSYYNKNGKLTRKSAPKAKLIYNGKAVGKWTPAVIDNVLFGDVTLASSNGSSYDLIIVNDYMVGKVTKKDASTQRIYADDLYDGMTGVKTLDFSDELFAPNVCNSLGENIGFEDIGAGDIVSVLKTMDGECVKIIVSSQKDTDFVLADYEKSEKLTLLGETKTYELSHCDSMLSPETPAIGKAYTVYFDYKGESVWFEQSALSGGSKVGVLLETEGNANGFTENYAVRLYDSGGKVRELVLEERITVNGSKYDADEAIDMIAPYITEAILYTTDDDSKILRSVVLPLDYGTEDTDNRGWYRVGPKMNMLRGQMTDTEWEEYIQNSGYKYEANSHLLDTFYAYNSAINTYFGIPATEDELKDDRMLSLNTASFRDGGRYLLNGYSKDALSISPEVFVGSSSGATGSQVDYYKAFLVSKVGTSVDADGEEVTTVKGYLFDYLKRNATESNMIISEDTVYIGPTRTPAVLDPEDPTLVRTPSAYDPLASGPCEIKPGDIFRFSQNADGSAKSIRLTYDHSTGNVFSCGGVAYPETGNHDVMEANTILGYPAYIRNGCIRMALGEQYLADYNTPEIVTDQTKYNSQSVQTATIFVVETLPKGVSIKKANLDDIITYEVSGTTPDKTILLSHWRGLNYGTIIYR